MHGRHQLSLSALAEIGQADGHDEDGLEPLAWDFGRGLPSVVLNAEAWWGGVSSLEDLLRLVEALRTRPHVRFGFDDYVQQPLALACLLAKLHQMERARAELRSWLAARDLPDATRVELTDYVESLWDRPVAES